MRSVRVFALLVAPVVLVGLLVSAPAGASTLSGSSVTDTRSEHSTSTTRSDFNGDGYSDLAVGVPFDVIGDFGAGAVNVLYGSPTGLSSAGNERWSQDSPGILDEAEADDYFGSAVATGDFNGDGISDLAVGAYGEGVGGGDQAGAVNVLYGSEGGLTSVGNQFWTQDSPGVEGDAETSDIFGWAVGSGDFDGDGIDDLAVGVKNDDVGSTEDAGSVNVLYGSRAGLTSIGDQLWTQDTPGVPDVAESDEEFARDVVSGDFDGDGFDDLGIGVPSESVDEQSQAGAINVLYGSPSGLSSAGNQFWTQASPGVIGLVESLDVLGFSLAAEDFNGDGFSDLAAGAILETLGVVSGGAVNVLYGSGRGLSPAGNQFWSQDSPGVEGEAESGDRFGWALAGGDFDADGFADLAVGARDKRVGDGYSAGAVNVLYGSSSGLLRAKNQYWTQDSPGVVGVSESYDLFGGALASGDFGNGPQDDLAVGAYGEALKGVSYAGVVNVLYGTVTGLSSDGNQGWSQDAPGVLGEVETFDNFGQALGSP
jgi:hypothetical protein